MHYQQMNMKWDQALNIHVGENLELNDKIIFSKMFYETGQTRQV